MSNTEERNTQIIQGLQEDGHNVWLDRLPGPSPTENNRETTRSRQRRAPKCSYCRCEGHNVLACEPVEKVDVIAQINDWIDVRGFSPLSLLTYYELKIQIKSFLQNLTNNRADDSILILYYVVLGIRNPSSALYGTRTAIRKIMEVVLNKRTENIFTVGTLEQRQRYYEEIEEDDNRQRDLLDRNRRLQVIVRLFNLRRDYLSYQNLVPSSNNALIEQERRHIGRLLINVHSTYLHEVEEYQRIYFQDPESIIFSRVTNVNVPRSVPIHNTNVVKMNKQVLLAGEEEEWTDIECPVCYEPIKADDVCATNCSHKFCYGCISKVLKTDQQHKCPCCRTKVEELVNKCAVQENEELKDVEFSYF